MRDTRNPEQLGLAIKELTQVGVPVLVAADAITGHGQEPAPRVPAQALRSNEYRPSVAPGTPRHSAPENGAHGR